MEVVPRNTEAFEKRINKLGQLLIKRFENLVELAAITNSDRNATALNAYQAQIETNAIIRGAEDILSLTRNMQELWLFGQLKTLEASSVQHSTDEEASIVARLLEEFTHPTGATDRGDDGAETAGDERAPSHPV
ncbi:hypothetical protein H2203_009250 [Taxawa tesnikishii (nom. ined.)]|nr:hypothetical protein H2203_009250 [Dothideales sp. JES 119]